VRCCGTCQLHDSQIHHSFWCSDLIPYAFHPPLVSTPFSNHSSHHDSSSSSSSPPPAHASESDFFPLDHPPRKRSRRPPHPTLSQQPHSGLNPGHAPAAAALAGTPAPYACHWNYFAPSKVFGPDIEGIDSSARGIYNENVASSSSSSSSSSHAAEAGDAIVNDGSDVVINFELFHHNQGKLMLSFACLGDPPHLSKTKTPNPNNLCRARR
jgi:hypothetical protein